MWSILLVEDEAYVREAIRETLDWERHGFYVAGEAGNGMEALEAILKLKPAVVIADIVMPGMDGIELLKETRKAGIRSRFIMLTAMSHFDYARDALQYGAFNYLLKLSLNDEVLLENLVRIERELLEELSVAGQALYPFYHRVCSSFRGVTASDDGDRTGISAAAEKFGPLELDIYAVLSGAVPAAPNQASIQAKDYLLIHPFHEGGQTTFFCWRFRKSATDANGSKPNRSVGFVAGSSLGQLSRDWRRALNQLNEEWYGQHGNPEAPMKERNGLPSITELEAELIRRFEERDERQCAEVTALMWRSMEASAFSPIEVKTLAAHLLHMLAMLAGRNAENWQELDPSVSHASLLAHVQQAIHTLIRQLKEEQVSYTDHPEVNRVIQYLLEHFKENIKVADLAKLVSINVDYLSTVFGKKTGLTPIAYLQNIRIKHAKRLLLHSKLNVEEIASQTGFADDAYFIKVFKRMVGQTPSSFRRENNT